MAKTVEQLMQEFKVEGLDDKFVTALRSEITEAHTQLSTATQLKTEAEQARAAAAAERQRIDQAILEMGDGSLNASRLKAQNKVMKAALDSLKEDGLSIDLPEDLFKETPDPEPKAGAVPKEMKDSLAVMGQAIAAADIAARYVGIYGKPLPMDMQTLVTSAHRACGRLPMLIGVHLGHALKRLDQRVGVQVLEVENLRVALGIEQVVHRVIHRKVGLVELLIPLAVGRKLRQLRRDGFAGLRGRTVGVVVEEGRDCGRALKEPLRHAVLAARCQHRVMGVERVVDDVGRDEFAAGRIALVVGYSREH